MDNDILMNNNMFGPYGERLFVCTNKHKKIGDVMALDRCKYCGIFWEESPAALEEFIYHSIRHGAEWVSLGEPSAPEGSRLAAPSVPADGGPSAQSAEVVQADKTLSDLASGLAIEPVSTDTFSAECEPIPTGPGSVNPHNWLFRCCRCGLVTGGGEFCKNRACEAQPHPHMMCCTTTGGCTFWLIDP